MYSFTGLSISFSTPISTPSLTDLRRQILPGSAVWGYLYWDEIGKKQSRDAAKLQTYFRLGKCRIKFKIVQMKVIASIFEHSFPTLNINTNRSSSTSTQFSAIFGVIRTQLPPFCLNSCSTSEMGRSSGVWLVTPDQFNLF